MSEVRHKQKLDLNVEGVGRGKELEELGRLLQRDGTVAIAAAAGMGGVGKTELAQQYVRLHREDYGAGIWWLERVGQILRNGLFCGWPEPPDNLVEEGDKVRRVYNQWLEQFPEGERLLVWDDEEDFGKVRALLPQDRRFRVLLTTRKRWGPPVQRLTHS